MMHCHILDYGIVSAMGTSVDACKSTLFAPTLPPLAFRDTAEGKPLPVFEVSDIPRLPEAFRKYDCRNNRLALLCFEQIARTVSDCQTRIPPARLGVVVGSSTSGLDASESAYREFKSTGVPGQNCCFHTRHAMGSLSRFIAELSGAEGPAYTLSTACSSAAKAMLSARGLIEAGICDMVISGGVDSLCDLTINGFNSLGQLSEARINPLSEHRNGLNIGEGGALFVLARQGGRIALFGGGESMDAYHMSAPLPDGAGAALAMERALQDAGMAPGQVRYVNLHGTGTRANDAMESNAVHRTVPDAYASSTKPFTGHCLGAAGAVEAAICCMSLDDEQNRLPAHLFDGQIDPTLPPLKLVVPDSRIPESRTGQCYLSNSFAFGGSNCTLVLGKTDGGVQ